MWQQQEYIETDNWALSCHTVELLLYRKPRVKKQTAAPSAERDCSKHAGPTQQLCPKRTDLASKPCCSQKCAMAFLLRVFLFSRSAPPTAWPKKASLLVQRQIQLLLMNLECTLVTTMVKRGSYSTVEQLPGFLQCSCYDQATPERSSLCSHSTGQRVCHLLVQTSDWLSDYKTSEKSLSLLCISDLPCVNCEYM